MTSASINDYRKPVARVGEIAPGKHKIISIGNKTIGIFNVNGNISAILNVCPHELGPVCQGKVGGTTLPSQPGEYNWGRDGEIIFCPWHGWEFDMQTGVCLTDPTVRLRLFPISVEDSIIYIHQKRPFTE